MNLELLKSGLTDLSVLSTIISDTIDGMDDKATAEKLTEILNYLDCAAEKLGDVVGED